MFRGDADSGDSGSGHFASLPLNTRVTSERDLGRSSGSRGPGCVGVGLRDTALRTAAADMCEAEEEEATTAGTQSHLHQTTPEVLYRRRVLYMHW